MTLLHEASDSKKFDVRIVERNVDRGTVRPEEYEKVLKSLPDDSANATWVSLAALAAEEGGAPSENGRLQSANSGSSTHPTQH